MTKNLSTKKGTKFLNDATTPSKKREVIPRVLFKNKPKKKAISHAERNKKLKINKDIEEMNLEILLLNTLTITATKVQTVINEFMQDDFCTNIFVSLKQRWKALTLDQ